MSLRTFFAVEIGDSSIKEKIFAIQKKLTFPETRIAFVAKENLHFTLKFLGDIDEKLVPKLEKEAAKIQFSKFPIELKGMGCLPSMDFINAIYLDLSSGAKELSDLAQKIESLSALFNFKKENRPFTPHLTIGRVKQLSNKELLVKTINQLKTEYFGKSVITSFKLKKSDLTPQGSIYTDLFEIKFTQ